MHVDEMSNEDLARRGHSEHQLIMERDRVERLIQSRVLTGDDLSHWIERGRILRSLIFSGTRAAQ